MRVPTAALTLTLSCGLLLAAPGAAAALPSSVSVQLGPLPSTNPVQPGRAEVQPEVGENLPPAPGTEFPVGPEPEITPVVPSGDPTVDPTGQPTDVAIATQPPAQEEIAPSDPATVQPEPVPAPSSDPVDVAPVAPAPAPAPSTDAPASGASVPRPPEPPAAVPPAAVPPADAGVAGGDAPVPAGYPEPLPASERTAPTGTPTGTGQPQADGAVVEAQVSTGPPLRYVAAGILSIVAVVIALGIAVVAQPRRHRRTH